MIILSAVRSFYYFGIVLTVKNLYQKIYAKVAEVPLGSVASYGMISHAVGLYNGARTVGWALQNMPLESNAPWHRVVNKDGYLTISHPIISADIQKNLLENEGVEVIKQNDLWRIKKPCWHKY